MGALEALQRRRSQPKVTDEAPTSAELLPLIAAAARVADYGDLKPWRLIEVRGDARDRVGRAIAEASGLIGKDALKTAAKPLRAPLLIAVVACRRSSHKVELWEQDAAAAGVAHMLSLLLDEAGWGVMWRSGRQTRTDSVRAAHRLEAGEELLGWLYVGRPAKQKSEPKRRLPPEAYVSSL